MPRLSRLLALTAWCLVPSVSTAQTPIPDEPVDIGTTSQLVLDSYIVDNTWAMRYKAQHVERVFHAPKKEVANPLIKGDMGYVCVARDAKTGIFHMWYQTHIRGADEDRTQYAIAYATSKDGLAWDLPKLGLHEWKGNKDNNVVIRGLRGRASSPWLLDVPDADRKGYEYLLLYRDSDGTHLAGTKDGIHFDRQGDRIIQHLHSDTQNAIVYDPHRKQYVMYCRAKNIYRAGGKEMIDTGESRRIARVTSPALWGDWSRDASQVLIPDELDTKNKYHAFYGMPTKVYGGVFFGFLWPFRWNDRIHTELAWSRDGKTFDRHPLRPRLVDYGPAGSWDDEMVFADGWIEVGDEWWVYYAGSDGPHGEPDRNNGIGLARMRKEGFVSLRGPSGGGVVCTRVVRWPGGNLRLNADAGKGKITVRVSGPDRKPIPGFDHADCSPIATDSTASKVAWKEKSLDSLQGMPIRLEIYMQNADLFSFRAEPQTP